MIQILIRELETVNFDKICRLALELIRSDVDPRVETVAVVKEAPCFADIDGDAEDREYWKKGGRSMTELYALRMGLGTSDASGTVLVASPIVGLVSLCEKLAENHGHVKDASGAAVNAGSLYQPRKIPNYARNLSVLPTRASEIVGMLLKAVVEALDDARPIDALKRMADESWDAIEKAMSAGELKIFEESRDVSAALADGSYEDGERFPLAHAPNGEEGVRLTTRNPNLVKHLWVSLREMGPAFKVAAIVAVNPDTGRVAVLSAKQYKVDIRPVAKALKERFPDAEIDVNTDRNSLVWDPRSGTHGPTAEQVKEAVSSTLGFRKEAPVVKSQRFGATLADRFRQQPKQKR